MKKASTESAYGRRGKRQNYTPTPEEIESEKLKIKEEHCEAMRANKAAHYQPSVLDITVRVGIFYE